jgi:hypothetical protein
MTHEDNWHLFENGQTLGTQGTEHGRILQDEEHRDGARITLEQCNYPPFAITCGIYGWMFHTTFAAEEQEAKERFDTMKHGLEEILQLIPYEDDPELETKMQLVYPAIEQFVRRF